ASPRAVAAVNNPNISNPSRRLKGSASGSLPSDPDTARASSSAVSSNAHRKAPSSTLVVRPPEPLPPAPAAPGDPPLLSPSALMGRAPGTCRLLPGHGPSATSRPSTGAARGCTPSPAPRSSRPGHPPGPSPVLD